MALHFSDKLYRVFQATSLLSFTVNPRITTSAAYEYLFNHAGRQAQFDHALLKAWFFSDRLGLELQRRAIVACSLIRAMDTMTYAVQSDVLGGVKFEIGHVFSNATDDGALVISGWRLVHGDEGGERFL